MDTRIEWVRNTYGWLNVSDEDALRLWCALPFSISTDARRTLLMNASQQCQRDVDKAVELFSRYQPPTPAPCIGVVRHDPFDADEEAYVAQHYACGERGELIAAFYARMREWWRGQQESPQHEGVDARHFPDMAYAGRVGITAMGQAIIRGLIRQYHEAA